jgi:hypothetical protein
MADIEISIMGDVSSHSRYVGRLFRQRLRVEFPLVQSTATGGDPCWGYDDLCGRNVDNVGWALISRELELCRRHSLVLLSPSLKTGKKYEQ